MKEKEERTKKKINQKEREITNENKRKIRINGRKLERTTAKEGNRTKG